MLNLWTFLLWRAGVPGEVRDLPMKSLELILGTVASSTAPYGLEVCTTSSTNPILWGIIPSFCAPSLSLKLFLFAQSHA